MADPAVVKRLAEESNLPEDYIRLMLDISEHPENYAERYADQETVTLEDNIIWALNDAYCFLKDGIIRKADVDMKALSHRQHCLLSNADERLKKDIEIETGYHAQSRGIVFSRIVQSFVDRSYSDLVNEFRIRAERSAKRKANTPSRKEWKEKWERQRQRFDGYIIGIDKGFTNTYPTGFSIRVLMKSADKADRSVFVEKKHDDILRWCMEEIPKQKKLMKEIGSLDFYTPTEIVVLESNEIEVFFETKKMVEDNDGSLL